MIQKIESQKQDVTFILEELFTENRGESLALQGGDESYIAMIIKEKLSKIK